MSQPDNILKLMEQLLNIMDVTEYEPAVPHMLVELFYRNVIDVLKTAQDHLSLRQSQEISEEDITYALHKLTKSLLQTPQPKAIQELAQQINGQPLPPIPDIPEITIPGESTSLIESQTQVLARKEK